MIRSDRAIRLGSLDVDVSDLVWESPSPGKPNLSLRPFVMPGGYPPAFSPNSITLARTGFEAARDDGSMGRATAIAYVSGLARLSEWLYATDRAAPGRAWDLTSLDAATARSFVASVKETLSKNTVEVSRNALAWTYEIGLCRKAPGFRSDVAEAIRAISYHDLSTPAVDAKRAPTLMLPQEAGLPAIPPSFRCKEKMVRIDGLRMVYPGTKAVRLERIIRPAGRPSVLCPRAQQMVLLYTVAEIESRSWARNQILNAVDRFSQWLAWHPQWRVTVEGFDWTDLSPELAAAYFEEVRHEPKGRDWWITLRSFYQWGVRKHVAGFDAAVARALANIGIGRAKTVHGSESGSDVVSRFQPDPSLPPIPPAFETRDRKSIVETTSPIWQRHDQAGNPVGAPLNFALLDDPPAGPQSAVYSMAFLHLVRLYVAHQASKEWSWRSTTPFVSMLRTFQAWLYERRGFSPSSFAVHQLSYHVLAAYKLHLEGGEGPGYSGPASMIRTFYKWGCDKGLTGFDGQILERLQDLKFTNNPRGELAQVLNPFQGAFSMTEQQVLKDVLDDPDWGTTEEKALVKLCWFLGPRPVQIAALRAKHLQKLVTPYGITYIVHMPRAKKRLHTDATVARGIPADYGLGQLLEEMCPPGTDPEREMFPSLIGRRDKVGAINRRLKHWAYHGGPHPLRTRRVLEEGKPSLLPIHAYRFRRTMATNLAREKATAAHIAYMLDDDDIRMALVYTENIGDLVPVLGDRVDQGEYLDILGGFLGEFESERHRSLPVIQAVAVDAPGGETLLDLGGAGRCGRGELCNLAWPLSCYACRYFRPRPGGPHEQMLANVDAIIAQNARRGFERHAGIFQRIREKIAIVIEAERRNRQREGNRDSQEAVG